MEEFELEPGETITRSVRKHWIILAAQLIPYFILVILPFFIPFAVQLLSNANPLAAARITVLMNHAGPWMQLVLAFWWLFLWIGTFNIFTRYFLTVWIITTTRIVEIHQYGFFSRQVSSFLLNRVQDVTTDVEGFLPTMFGFGTLNVETAGRDEKFQMNGIQNPTDLRDLIMREIAALHADGQMPQSGV
jgi:membrane protein YdbS with pleckstrin-like domain